MMQKYFQVSSTIAPQIGRPPSMKILFNKAMEEHEYSITSSSASNKLGMNFEFELKSRDQGRCYCIGISSSTDYICW